MDGLTASDVAMLNNDGFGGGNAFIWIFALLILAGGGFGNGFFGGRNTDAATKEDVYNSVQRSTDFAALERQNNEIMTNTSQVGQNVIGAIKDGNYNTLGEIRDIQASVAGGFADLKNCCCEQLRAIDSVNYNGAINTAAINANTTAQTQKILDAMATNRMADMQSQINQLQLQAALCGIPRVNNTAWGTYPYTAPYSGCGCGNI